MKLLKLILPVLLVLFMFNSCTTTEEEVDANEKMTFNAEYLANSEEFNAVRALIINESYSLEAALEFEKNNEGLLTGFIKKAIEETNFYEGLKTEIINNEFEPLNSESTNKSYSCTQIAEDSGYNSLTVVYLLYQIDLYYADDAYHRVFLKNKYLRSVNAIYANYNARIAVCIAATHQNIAAQNAALKQKNYAAGLLSQNVRR